MKPHKLSFIGGGNMAEAMIKGLLRQGIAAPEHISVSEPRPERARFLATTYRVTIQPDNPAAVREGEVIILAVKPQAMAGVLKEIAPQVTPRHLVISIAAGIPTSLLASALGANRRLVRAMPNTPAQIGEGAIALCGGGSAGPDDVSLARDLFSAIGKAHLVDEALMDAVTGLSGSGPAYVFLIIEALTDGGVKVGLPRDLAQALTLQTLVGAARMAVETGEHPGRLKDLVTSPGGTTIAALHVLEEKGLRGALINAVVAATERSRELSQAIKP